MKERKDLKHLIPWIVKACDDNLFPGLLEWKNRKDRIFFVTWVHKSSENWEKSKSTVFEAWANYKKKLGEKDDRDLKAAFRNALRSKKNNLKEISRSRNERTWKIICDSTESITSSNKTSKAKQRKANKDVTKFSDTPAITNTTSMQPISSSCSSTVYNSMMSNEVSLPPYQTLFHVSPPTPPKQQTDVYLDPQEELFHLQEEIMNLAQSSSFNDTYRAPSPLSVEVLNSPSSPSSIMNLSQSSSFNDSYRFLSSLPIEVLNSPSSPSSIRNLAQSSSFNDSYRFPTSLSIEVLNSPSSIRNSTQSSSFNDAYRVPSPLSIELLNSPSSPSLFDVFNEVDKNIPLTMNSTECVFNSPLDFNSLNNNGTQNESIVPNIHLNTWNQTNYDQNQFSIGAGIHPSYQQMLQEDLYRFSADC